MQKFKKGQTYDYPDLFDARKRVLSVNFVNHKMVDFTAISCELDGVHMKRSSNDLLNDEKGAYVHIFSSMGNPIVIRAKEVAS